MITNMLLIDPKARVRFQIGQFALIRHTTRDTTTIETRNVRMVYSAHLSNVSSFTVVFRSGSEPLDVCLQSCLYRSGDSDV